jgi:putative tryptophan/tyrosine transport system substrate-binding protein
MRIGLLLVCMLLPLPVEAQDQKLPVVGWLRIAATEAQPGQPLRGPLAARGLVDGTSIHLRNAVADGKAERLPDLARELVEEKAVVIVAFGAAAMRAAQAATKTIPIVAVGDFVGEGLVTNMTRPEGNTTGFRIELTDLDVRKLTVLKELLPEAKRFAVLNDASIRLPDRPPALAAASEKLSISLSTYDVRVPADLEPAFQAMQREGLSGVNVISSALFSNVRPLLGELSKKYRIPAVCQWAVMVEAGCVASYGTTLNEMYGVVTDYVARILAGTPVADLPAQQPKKFELVINEKVAHQIGLTIPHAVRSRASRVID